MDKILVKKTIQGYDDFADEMAKKFDAIGPRVKEINKVFKLIEKKNPSVLELGCANGRDAQEILLHTSDYIGIDGSEKLVKIARKRLPKAKFRVAFFDEIKFPPQSFDAVLDFASLFHYDKDSLRNILRNIAKWLSGEGVLLMSIKKGEYQKTVSATGFGERTQFLYKPQDIIALAEDYEVVDIEEQNLHSQDWFTIILKKK